DGWTVANHVLGNERFATGTPRMAAELIEDTKRLARATGAMDDPAFRDRLATLTIDHMGVSAYYRHGAQLHGAGKALPASSSVMKIQCGELAQRAAALLDEAAMGYGALAGEVPVADGSVHPTAPTFESRRMTVGSGTTEIQRVILARR